MSNLNENFDTMFNRMENFVSSKTVVGEPIKIGDTTIIPLVDVSFGMGAGQKSAVKAKAEKGGSAAGGMGAKISPTAIMIIQNGAVQILNVSNQTAIDKIVNMAPGIMNKLNFSSGARQKFEEEIITDKRDDDE
ncbi:MAG: GerW family sporulation protein [Firmicutes bacterium]|nr:GerW family sporulation protein [Bacillota bacterium]